MGTAWNVARNAGVDGTSTSIPRVTKLLKFARRTGTDFVKTDMRNSDDKAKLLRSLAIDRETSDVQRATRRRPMLIAGGAAAILVIAAVVAPQLPIDRVVGNAASRPSAPLPAQAPAAAPEPRPARRLAASGYVVARRKATVAAEITGKVVAVLVEEGNLVKEGQVVARLDSILAEQDLALAKSRIESAEAAIAVISADLDDAIRIMTRART